MKVRGFAHSDVGRERENNEDAFWLDDDLGAYVVCDGMGGHACGEKASALAIATVAGVLKEEADALAEISDGAVAGHTRLVSMAEQAVHAACREVHALACASPEHRGMGCTLTLLLVANNKAAMAHVGDTRLYLQRDGGVDQLSSDHTMAADFVRRAKLTPEAARTHRYSSALTRAIGPHATVQVETLILDVLPDDVFLLCSDGLSQYVESLGELAPYLTAEDLGASARALVELANERGGGDNITAIAVGFSVPEAQREERLHLDEGVRQNLASLRAADLFSEIPYAHLLRLYAVCESREVAKGETVLKVGDEVRGMVCVLAGSLRMEREDGPAKKLSSGENFGVPALLMASSSRVALVADEPSRLLFLEGERFRMLAANRPRVVLTLLSRMARGAFIELEREGRLSGLLPTQQTKAWWNPLTWARAAGWRA